MPPPCHEKRHRLSSPAYAGRVVAAFTINTLDGVPYFDSPRIVEIARAALDEAFALAHGHAGVYVFMPEHLHLIVSGSDEHCNLLALVKDFKQKTTYRIRRAGFDFHWQKDFYDHIIRANEDYGAQVRYLLRNPVRRGLCQRWEAWPHRGILGQTWEQLALHIVTL